MTLCEVENYFKYPGIDKSMHFQAVKFEEVERNCHDFRPHLIHTSSICGKHFLL